MTTTYELYTNEDGTPKAVEGKAPAIIERVEALETDVTGLDTALAGKASNADLSSLTAEVTKDLQAVNTALEGKANSSHTHTVSQITDMPNVVLSVNNITPASGGNVNLGLHAVATSGNYNDLSNTPEAYVILYWHAGASWYRKWSDGFIEQGGVTSESVSKISLHIAMSSTDYVVTIAQRNASDTWSTHVDGRYYTYFSVGKPYGSGVCWYVAGY